MTSIEVVAQRTGLARGGLLVGTLLLCLMMLPTTLFYTGLVSSTAPGTVLASLIALGLAFAGRVQDRYTKQALRASLLIAVVLAMHLVIVASIIPVDFKRGLSSVMLLCICFVGAAATANLLASAAPAELRRGVRTCLYVLGLVALLGVLGWLQPGGERFTKPVFPFSEPSHLALVVSPFLLCNCVLSKPGARIAYILVALAAATLLQNLTLAAVCLLAALICLRVRHLMVMAAIVIPLALGLDLSYYLDRLDFSGDTRNLSSLVFLQGWQMLGESWDATHGIGRGFQQFGLLGTEVPAADLILAILKDYLNLLDGGFTLAKVVGEGGVFGVSLIAAYLLCALRAAALLRSVARGVQTVEPLMVLTASSIVGYSIELFLRGAGYFTGTGLLLLASLLIWRARARGKGLTVSHAPNSSLVTVS